VNLCLTGTSNPHNTLKVILPWELEIIVNYTIESRSPQKRIGF